MQLQSVIYLKKMDESIRHNFFCDSEFHAYAIIRPTLTNFIRALKPNQIPLVRKYFYNFLLFIIFAPSYVNFLAKIAFNAVIYMILFIFP